MLSTRGLTKAYDATVALRDFAFDVLPGEVIGVIGENGAGKSTLMKLLSGIVSPTSGSIDLFGKPMHFKKPVDAMHAGIAMVHQELNLIPTLSVEDNLFLGREIGGVTVNRAETRIKAERLLARVGAKFAPQTLCGELSVAEQQLVEIAKAVSENAKLVIFDEPTAVLSDVESEKLFQLIFDLKAEGISVLYVSHRLPEILRLCDRLVCLRDGVKVGEADPKQMTERQLADMMVGRSIEDVYPPKGQATSDEPFAEFEGFFVRKGEILGLGGLIGSGRTEFCEGLLGLRSPKKWVKREGKTHSFKSVKEAGWIGYVSEDRKGKGLVTSMSIIDNIGLANLGTLNTHGKRKANADEWIAKLGIKTKTPELPMTSLSGGNQQKCSIAKWLTIQPELLILDEPTRGVDVGAKAEIYQIIADLAANGTAVILISSELPELIGLSHRVVVFKDFAPIGELDRDELSESSIMALAAGLGKSESGAA